MIDSAQAYNEEHVGFALKESGVPREEVFIVSKVHPRFLGYEETLKSVEESLKKLQVQILSSFLRPVYKHKRFTCDVWGDCRCNFNSVADLPKPVLGNVLTSSVVNSAYKFKATGNRKKMQLNCQWKTALAKHSLLSSRHRFVEPFNPVIHLSAILFCSLSCIFTYRVQFVYLHCFI